MLVDLQKSYDWVDRKLLWKVLARAGVQEEMIAVIRQFYDGMQARVRMDDGELSDFLSFSFSLISLIADIPHHYHPVYGH